MATLVRASVFPIRQSIAQSHPRGAVATNEIFGEPATLSRNWLTVLVAQALPRNLSSKSRQSFRTTEKQKGV
jgi:hypothetical protein